MRHDEVSKDWAPAVAGALALGLVLAFASGGIFMLCAPAGAGPVGGILVGAMIGTGVFCFMLWLFYWDQVTVKDIWRAIGDAWNALGKL